MEEPQDLPEQPVSTFKNTKNEPVKLISDLINSVQLFQLIIDNKPYIYCIYLEVKNHFTVNKTCYTCNLLHTQQ